MYISSCVALKCIRILDFLDVVVSSFCVALFLAFKNLLPEKRLQLAAPTLLRHRWCCRLGNAGITVQDV